MAEDKIQYLGGVGDGRGGQDTESRGVEKRQRRAGYRTSGGGDLVAKEEIRYLRR